MPEEFTVEEFFGDVEKGVLARLYDQGQSLYDEGKEGRHPLLRPLCGGIFDAIKVGSPFCAPLESALYSHFVPMLRERHDKTRGAESNYGEVELPCKDCPHRAEKLVLCAPHCPSLKAYIERMPVKVAPNGKINPRPCTDCEIHEFGKNVCAKHCQSIKTIQGGTSVTRGTRNTANGGRHRRGKQGRP